MKFQPILVEETDFAPGVQRVYRFQNGYGASVVQHPFLEKGTVELAVLQFESETSWSVTYDTPITDDVMVVKEEELEAVLESISKIDLLYTPQGWKYYEDMVVIRVLGSEEPEYFGGIVHRSALKPF